MACILVIAYLVLGYWATGKTIYANKIVIYTGTALAAKRFALGFTFGWVLIPIALIRVLLHI